MIDFHLHAFPDAIAERAIAKLSQVAKLQPQTDGTVKGLLDYMQHYGITQGAIMPVATKPEQQQGINLWARDVQAANAELVCFGSAYPGAADCYNEIKHIRDLGLKGVKLHPDYQNFFFNDPQHFAFYEKVIEEGLPLMIHAGNDPFSPQVVHATPRMIREVADRYPELTMIAAHMGGCRMPDEAEEALIGTNVYIDISMSVEYTPPEQMKRMIANHGADKVLFASDVPWGNAGRNIEALNTYELTDEQKQLIFEGNARRLIQF